MQQSIRSMSALVRTARCHTLLLPRTKLFHTSSRVQTSLLETCYSQTFEAMTALHSSTGLSWVYILPITAVAIRSAVAVPLSIWSRLNLQKMRDIQPLLLAWMPRIQRQIRKENPGLHPEACEKIIRTEHKKKVKEVRKQFGISILSVYAPLVQIPFFLVTIETIRQMCIGKTGILGWISAWFSGKEPEATIAIQESLTTEGGLWFPNLLQPDPYYILPFALSGMLYWSVVYNERIQGTLRATRTARFSVISILLKILPVGLLFVTPYLPAAMVLYWTSSSAFALATTFTIEKLMPISKGMVPCRPLVKPYMRNHLASQQQRQQGAPRSALSRWVSENL